ncbi:hypothetical protein C9374_008986 [Naegleria lovaniensis]|uniref:Mediator of RNA polymerase II transcription subunit 7 n=1 Tax=Naegleria lovaniensis TaxID=51637 RepID=A0AA88GK34_NAELO|nr:uncharacterized protein C9374_008986 [Naegleria lovaniensis]KAG2377901.1 hypothetical protein C9374_008986 [Naegleria lovaniensis]
MQQPNTSEEQEFVDVFPPPPTFYKLYHPSKSEYIAPEPPKPLKKGQTYQSFGETLTAIPDFNPIPPGYEVVKKLYDTDRSIESIDHVAELKKLNRSLLYNFLELLDLLVEHPTLQVNETEELSTVTNFDSSKASTKYCWELKLYQIELIFINMSFILNYYRPHQAREQMITILQNQLKRRREVTESVGDCIQYCHKVLKEAHTTLTSVNLEELEFLRTVGGEPASSALLESDSSIADFYVEKSSTMKRKREEEEQTRPIDSSLVMNGLNNLDNVKKTRDTNSTDIVNVELGEDIMKEFFH